MAFLVINSNSPLNKEDPLISFRVQGREVAALLPTGALEVEGVGFPDETYITSACTCSAGVDGGNF